MTKILRNSNASPEKKNDPSLLDLMLGCLGLFVMHGSVAGIFAFLFLGVTGLASYDEMLGAISLNAGFYCIGHWLNSPMEAKSK